MMYFKNDDAQHNLVILFQNSNEVWLDNPESIMTIFKTIVYYDRNKKSGRIIFLRIRYKTNSTVFIPNIEFCIKFRMIVIAEYWVELFLIIATIRIIINKL